MAMSWLPSQAKSWTRNERPERAWELQAWKAWRWSSTGIACSHGNSWDTWHSLTHSKGTTGNGKIWDLLRSLLKAPTSPMLVARSSRPCHFLATLGRRHITTPQLWPNLAANVCAEFVPLRSSRIRLSLSTTCGSMHRWSRYLVFNLPSGKLTYQWNISMFTSKHTFKGSIVHCYVSLPKGTSLILRRSNQVKCTGHDNVNFFPNACRCSSWICVKYSSSCHSNSVKECLQSCWGYHSKLPKGWCHGLSDFEWNSGHTSIPQGICQRSCLLRPDMLIFWDLLRPPRWDYWPEIQKSFCAFLVLYVNANIRGISVAACCNA